MTAWFVLAEPLVELSCESLWFPIMEHILASCTGLSAAQTLQMLGAALSLCVCAVPWVMRTWRNVGSGAWVLGRC